MLYILKKAIHTDITLTSRDICLRFISCADPERGQGIRPPPLKNHKNIGFLRNTGPDSLKNQQTTTKAWKITLHEKRKKMHLPNIHRKQEQP